MRKLVCLYCICFAFLSSVQQAKSQEFELASQSSYTVSGDAAFGLVINILVQNQEYVRALELLETRPDIVETESGFRLRVQLLIELGRLTQALSSLETRLADNPNDAISRFQIGEIHFRSGRDRAATTAMSLALAGILPQVQREIANSRLASLRARRPIHFGLTAAIVPDSNINSATRVAEIEIFGLPFALDESAREKSGVGIELNGTAERSQQLEDGTISRVGLLASFFDAPGIKFDLQTVSLNSSLDAQLSPNFMASLSANYGVVRYGGEFLENSFGAEVETTFFANNTKWQTNASARLIGGTGQNRRTGRVESISIERVRYLSPSSYWDISIGYAHRKLIDKSQSYSHNFYKLGRQFPAPFRTNVYLQTMFLTREYEQRNLLYVNARRDQEISLALQITKPNWVIFEAHPFIAFEYSRNDSNIALNDYERNRVRFGMSYEF